MIISNYCIENKNETSLGDYPCNCYKKIFSLAYKFKVYEVKVCQHWMKYLIGKNYYTNGVGRFQPNTIIIELLLKEILDIDIYSNNAFTESFINKNDSDILRYINNDLWYDGSTRKKHVSISTVKNRIMKDPYFFETVFFHKTIKYGHKIHISEIIKALLESRMNCNNLYYYNGGLKSKTGYNLAKINDDNLVGYLMLAKSFVKNVDLVRNEKSNSFNMSEYQLVGFASKFLIENYKTLQL